MYIIKRFLKFFTKKSNKKLDNSISINYIAQNAIELHDKMIYEYKKGNTQEAKILYNKLLDERKKLLYLDYEFYEIDYAILLLIGVKFFNEKEENLNRAKEILSSYPDIDDSFINSKLNNFMQ